MARWEEMSGECIHMQDYGVGIEECMCQGALCHGEWGAMREVSFM